MSAGTIVAIIGAILFHAGVLLFGGLLFPTCKPEGTNVQDVELMGAEDPTTKEEKKEPEVQPAPEELEAETEEAPDAAEMLKALDAPSSIDAPALEAASLSAIEQALNGATAMGDFAESLSFASGGRIGGTGSGAAMDKQLVSAEMYAGAWTDVGTPARLQALNQAHAG